MTLADMFEYTGQRVVAEEGVHFTRIDFARKAPVLDVFTMVLEEGSSLAGYKKGELITPPTGSYLIERLPPTHMHEPVTQTFANQSYQWLRITSGQNWPKVAAHFSCNTNGGDSYLMFKRNTTRLSRERVTGWVAPFIDDPQQLQKVVTAALPPRFR